MQDDDKDDDSEAKEHGRQPADSNAPPENDATREASNGVARTPDAVLPAFSPEAFTFTAETPWERVAMLYLAGLDNENTRRTYERPVYAGLRLLGVRSLGDLTVPMLAAYRAFVIKQPLAPSSQALTLAALRSFLVWSAMLDAHSLPAEKVRHVLKSPKRTPLPARDLPTNDEIAHMLSQLRSRRDHAMIMTFLGAGLRISELVGLDASDLHRARDSGGLYLHVRNGKGGKDRHVPVQADVERALRDYLTETERSIGDPGPLFRAYDSAHKSGKPHGSGPTRRRFSSRGCAYRVVKKVFERAGLDPRLTPHSLRHTYALLVYRASRDVLAVQKLLGHESLDTTHTYLNHLSVDELRAAVPLLPTAGPSSVGVEGESPKPRPARRRTRRTRTGYDG